MRDSSLLDGIVKIHQDPDSCESIYMANHLVQCTMPHSDPGNVPIWSRKNGFRYLSIRPYLNRDTMTFLYPYGTIPRLILIWLSTEATIKKSRKIELGGSINEFLREIGLNPQTGRGKRGDATRLLDQMERLCRATFAIDDHRRSGKHYHDMQIAPRGWWEEGEETGSRTPGRSSHWHGWIELSDDFYSEIIRNPIPADRRAVCALKRSPLAIDLYMLMAYKTDAANRKRDKGAVLLPIPWDGLFLQMGSEYKQMKHFKAEVKSALGKIRKLSQMQFEILEEGIRVHPGQPPVPYAERPESVQ